MSPDEVLAMPESIRDNVVEGINTKLEEEAEFEKQKFENLMKLFAG